jgi:hypothetical protein
MNNVAAPVHLPSLTAARQRSGMRNISELVDCLIRYYDAKSQILDSRPKTSGVPAPASNRLNQLAAAPSRTDGNANENQATFDWYDSSKANAKRTSR